MFSIFQPTRTEVSMLNKNNSGSVNNWAYVVMAILAVNKFTLEDVFALSKKLEANGLFDLHNLASWDFPKIFSKLKQSGYNKPDFVVGLLTERLMSLGELTKNIHENEKILNNGSNQEVADLLLEVKGIGPVVLQNILLLRDKSKQ